MVFREAFAKQRQKFEDILAKNGLSSTPPPVPSASKPPYNPNLQQSLGPPPPPYWQADFSPSNPVTANFRPDLGAGGWGNNEAQTYVSRPENAFHAQGNALVLRAIAASHLPPEERYTSTRFNTHATLGRAQGFVTATLTAPCARGIWPAFWLLPSEPFAWPTDGEVDIFEAWNASRTNHACLHWGHFTPADAKKHRVAETPLPELGMRAYRFGWAWEQPPSGDGGRCVWYVDGVPVMRASRPPGTRRFEDWRVVLNIAMGGDVCNKTIPADGVYDFVVHELKFCEEPEGGWPKFEQDWGYAAEGHTM
ncbi:concanavalin A-like lectin/glucanase [Trichodelitschia bisporula]|uniref:Concanavalin A-like lectin/glucanase n=1 Tax=Trichodelitschia bisporula TaxID=703511 RepID=A0A6G1IAQ9_9PEZI|nr:concanavalin A-like lectin/glucanase [Trichodelitschia bisporula]